uniref:Uncharacterized protein TCIL3000_11_15090 n=1 Tax=Trypanosoma congolense (strain IL3000) TaxID=1068625 RepID=G0V2W9_TRYCI|nr:unnamed protein product [Trypanosoma congolense IL3000]
MVDVDVKINEMRSRLLNIKQALQCSNDSQNDEVSDIAGVSPHYVQTDSTVTTRMGDGAGTRCGVGLLFRDAESPVNLSSAQVSQEKVDTNSTMAYSNSPERERTPSHISKWVRNVLEEKQEEGGCVEHISTAKTVGGVAGGDTATWQATTTDRRAMLAPLDSNQPLRGGPCGFFDPLQALESRIRDKLQKRTFLANPQSNEANFEGTPSPRGSVVQKNALLDTQVKRSWSTEGQTPGSKTMCSKDEQIEDNCERQDEREYSPHALDIEVPSYTQIERLPKQKGSISMKGPPTNVMRGASRPASVATNSHRQRQQPNKPLYSESYDPVNNNSTGKLAKDFSSNCRPKAHASRSHSRTEVGSSSESCVRHVLPRKAAPQTTILDVLTGAEFFALMRLRGIIVSRGDTGEWKLPESRCHSVYLSPKEHQQLLDLRASLRLQSDKPTTPQAADAVTKVQKQLATTWKWGPGSRPSSPRHAMRH